MKKNRRCAKNPMLHISKDAATREISRIFSEETNEEA
jgi:hypothetical protein